MKDLKESFYTTIKTGKRTESTIESIERVLEDVQRYIKKPLHKAEWEDIAKFIEHMNDNEYADSTISLYRSKLKQFYKFCFDETEDVKYRKLMKKVNGSNHECTIEAVKKLTPKDILTPEEVKKLINVATHEKWRCIVAVLFESGMRIGELLSLKWLDVQMDDSKQEVTFHVPELPGCKTGARSILCTDIYGYVQDWLKCYSDPSPTAKFMPMTRFGISVMLDKLYERAKITGKPNNPHILRHSAITEAVHIGMQESAIKLRFWGNLESSMLGVYVHLNEMMQAQGYRNAKGMGNGNGNTVINPLAVRCVNCGRLIQSGSLCKTCEDSKKLSEENSALKSEMETMRKDMAKIQEFIKMGGMELLKRG